MDRPIVQWIHNCAMHMPCFLQYEQTNNSSKSQKENMNTSIFTRITSRTVLGKFWNSGQTSKTFHRSQSLFFFLRRILCIQPKLTYVSHKSDVHKDGPPIFQIWDSLIFWNVSLKILVFRWRPWSFEMCGWRRLAAEKGSHVMWRTDRLSDRSLAVVWASCK